MNNEDVRQKLSQITTNSEYIRVSGSHPLELYLGKNEAGYPTLRYNGFFNPVKLFGNRLLEIKQVKTSSNYSLLFSFASSENISLFCSFCADIISQTEDCSNDNGYIEIVNRYNQWRKMFYSSSKLLNESEIIGLIGELLFLKDYAINKYGTSVAINGWSGPIPTHKDFSYDDDWFEIKTINSFKKAVNISSLEQLDSENKGYLVVHCLEKMSPKFNGISLNPLIKGIFETFALESDKDIFIEKLKQVGYSYREEYDDFVYNLVSTDTYAVFGDFPRLKASDLPNGVTEVKYEILLNDIKKYKEKLP